jgi:hypothetical protein
MVDQRRESEQRRSVELLAAIADARAHAYRLAATLGSGDAARNAAPQDLGGIAAGEAPTSCRGKNRRRLAAAVVTAVRCLQAPITRLQNPAKHAPHRSVGVQRDRERTDAGLELGEGCANCDALPIARPSGQEQVAA